MVLEHEFINTEEQIRIREQDGWGAADYEEEDQSTDGIDDY